MSASSALLISKIWLFLHLSRDTILGMADTKTINVALDMPENTTFEALRPMDLGRALDAEVALFEHWFKLQGNEPLVMAERAILKTYLAWKLKFEGKD